MIESLEGRKFFAAVAPTDVASPPPFPEVNAAQTAELSANDTQGFHFVKKVNTSTPGLNYSKIEYKGLNYSKVSMQDFHFVM
jgi:hypothetical protein